MEWRVKDSPIMQLHSLELVLEEDKRHSIQGLCMLQQLWALEIISIMEGLEIPKRETMQDIRLQVAACLRNSNIQL